MTDTTLKLFLSRSEARGQRWSNLIPLSMKQSVQNKKRRGFMSERSHLVGILL